MLPSFRNKQSNVARTAVLELGGDSLSFALLEQLPDGPRLRWKRLPLTMEGQGHRFSIDREALANSLRKTTQDEKLVNVPLHVVLSGDFCVTRIVSGSNDDVQRELAELQHRSGFYLSLGNGSKTFSESVLALDAKRSHGAFTVTNESFLSQVLDVVEEANFQVLTATHSLVALARAVGKTGVDATSPALIVELTKRGLDLGVSYCGRLMLDYRPGGQGDFRQRADVVLQHLGRIQRHCARQIPGNAARIERVVISGDGPEVEELRSYFEQTGKLRAEVFDPASVFPQWNMSEAGTQESWLAPMLGALVDRDDHNASKDSPDLMVPIRLLKREPLIPGLIRHAWPIAAVILLTFGVLGIGLNKQAAVASVEAEASQAKKNAELISVQRIQLAQLDTKIKSLKVIGERVARPQWQDFLVEIGSCFPDGMWLEEVRVERDGTISLSGPTFSENSVYELIENLKGVPTLANVALEGTRSAKLQSGPVTLFDIKAVYRGRSESNSGS